MGSIQRPNVEVLEVALMDDQVRVQIVGDASGAVGSIKEVSSATVNLDEVLKATGASGERAGQQIAEGAKKAEYSLGEARHGAMLLSEELGVKMPRALAGFAAKSETIGPLLEKAFQGLAIVGFIDLAKQAGEAISEMASKTFIFTDSMRGMQTAIIADNSEIAALQEHMKSTVREMELIGKNPVQASQMKLGFKTEDLGDITGQIGLVTEQLEKLKAAGDKDESIFQEMQQGWREMGFDTGAMTTAETAIAQLTSKLGVLQQKQKSAMLDVAKASEEAAQIQAKAEEEMAARGAAALKKLEAEHDRLYDELQRTLQEQQKVNQEFANTTEKDVFKSVEESDKSLNDQLKISSERLHLFLQALKDAKAGKIVDIDLPAMNAAEANLKQQIQTVAALQQQWSALKNQVTSMNNVFSSSFAKWAVEGQSFTKSFIKGFQSMEVAAVQSLAKVAVSMLEGLAISEITGNKERMEAARTAAAKAYQAEVGIPYIGPIVAPIVAAGAFASVMAFDQGGIVPNIGPDDDVNLALMRPNEMVLPPDISTRIQQMTEASGSGDTHHHYSVTAMDAKSFTDFAKRNGPAFGAGVHAAARGGHINAKKLVNGK